MRPAAKHVVIVGAGFAGASAARRCADAGWRVTLCETARRPGGRASSFNDAVTGLPLDNGQHLLASPYHATLDLLSALGTDHLVEHQERFAVSFVTRGGKATRLAAGSPSLGRLALPLGLLATDHLSFVARVQVVRAMLAMRSGDASAVGDRTIDQYLCDLGQSPEARVRFWHPFVLAVMNNDAARASAALLVTVVHRFFFDRRVPPALIIPRAPLSQLLAPIASYLEERGGAVRYGARVVGVNAPSDTVCGVTLADGSQIACDAVVLACNAHHARRLLPAEWQDKPPFAALSMFEASPIVSVYLSYDRPIVDSAIVGCIDSPIHWIFDRNRLLADHDDARHTVCCVTSAADGLAERAPVDLAAMYDAELRAVAPRAREARLLASRVIREKRATFVSSPAAQRLRPQARTPVAGLVLAGDWTDTALPATIEGACVSGDRAAACVCSLES